MKNISCSRFKFFSILILIYSDVKYNIQPQIKKQKNLSYHTIERKLFYS